MIDKCLTAFAVACLLVLAAFAMPAPAQPPAPVAQADGPAAFMSLLNAERARYGRPPLAWDARLAAFAATNTGYDASGRYTLHSPGSTGGAMQCAYGARSYVAAFHAFMASGAHRGILMNARSTVGVAVSAWGITSANCW